MQKKLLLTYCLISAFLYLHAQKFNFRNYTVVDGLGSSNINYIFQDSKGYIWFATQDAGASRYDGKTFANFTKADGLISNDVTFITEDKAGNIWIATAAGASKFDNNRFSDFGSKQGLSDNTVYSIYASPDGTVWFALKDGGIKIYNGQTFDSLTLKSGLPSNDVYSINRDTAGKYWLGLANGIEMFNGHGIKSYNYVNYIKGKTFFSTATDNEDNIWFGSTSGDLVIIQPDGTTKQLALPRAFANCFIGGITCDRRGNIWLATDHGALKYKDGDFTAYTEKQGLSVSLAQSVFCDYEGKLWIGTLGGGANLLASEAFASYTQSDGLTTSNVNGICEDKNLKTYYVGTSGSGLFTFNPAEAVPFSPVLNIAGLKNANVSCVYTDSRGLLWVIAQEGVFKLRNINGVLNLIKRYQTIAGQKLISPQQIAEDTKGNLWIATFGAGIFEISAGKEKQYATGLGSLSDNILTIFSDSGGNIWAGTLDAGLLKFTGDKFTGFNPNNAIIDKAIWSVTEDNEGNLYLGSGENGIYCCCANTDKIINYNIKNGLCSDFIPAIKWDKAKNVLWLGSEKGVNKAEFDNNHKILSISTYDKTSGYNSWGINQNSIFTDHEGQVWFGSVNGLWRYNAKMDFLQVVPPKIQLASIRLAYQKVDWRNYCDSIDYHNNLPVGLKLSYKNNHLTFDVKGLSTGNISYSYMLEGQDKEWSPLTTNSEADYSNISPGKSYVLKARAVNNEGVWSAATIEFPFAVEPPWWNTWIFKIMFFLAIIVIVVIVIKTRERALRMQNLKLEKTVKDRTAEVIKEKEESERLRIRAEGLNFDLENKNAILEKLNLEKNSFLGIVAHDLKNPLGIVRMFAEISADSGTPDDKKQHYLKNIAIATERMYELVNNLLDINTIESGRLNLSFEDVNLKALVSGLAEQVSALAAARNIRVMAHLPTEEVILKTDKARLTQVIENYISNALKYSPPDTTVNIYLNATNALIEVRIADEGPGISINEQRQLFRPYGVASTTPFYGENKTGLGLAIVRKIAEALNAETGCISEKGRGCEFYIRFTKG